MFGCRGGGVGLGVGFAKILPLAKSFLISSAPHVTQIMVICGTSE
jgi:hypothetical protein